MYTSVDNLYKTFLQHPHVSTDTRTLHRGDLFVALHGERFDGNAYVRQALEKGASAAIVDHPMWKSHEKCLYVRDTLVALQELAAYHRKHLNIPVVGVTGTNGKTTSKELIRSILERKYNLLATEGNLNNHIGVPLTILKITQEHQLALIEMGAGAPGEIRTLVEIAQPTMGLITNIGKAHLKGFGNIEGVLSTKSELPQYLLNHGGTFLLNSDDSRLKERWGGSADLTYGTEGQYVSGEIICSSPYLVLRWKSQGEEQTVQTNLVGGYNLSNVLSAVAVGTLLGLSAEQINKGIEAYVPTNHRSQYICTEGERRYIVDAYNANPSSMRAALTNLVATPAEHKVAILGDMLELGEEEEKEHEEVVKYLDAHREIKVLLCGNIFHSLAKKGMRTFPTVEELRKHLREHPIEEDTLTLLKGSHGIGLQTLLPDLGCDK